MNEGISMNEHVSLKSRLIVTPLRAGLRAGVDAKIDVLVRLQAPEAPANSKRRPPYGVALVIDRSGSMSGRPIEEAKRCGAFVLEWLHKDDKVSLTQFDDRVEVLASARDVADAGPLRTLLASIVTGDSTNLHGGWRAGADSLAALQRDMALRRVVLLSDGQANHGLVDAETIAAMPRARRAWRHHEHLRPWARLQRRLDGGDGQGRPR
jgi:Ca-activated chloride channel family protein